MALKNGKTMGINFAAWLVGRSFIIAGKHGDNFPMGTCLASDRMSTISSCRAIRGIHSALSFLRLERDSENETFRTAYSSPSVPFTIPLGVIGILTEYRKN